jgi:hypothetical protein
MQTLLDLNAGRLPQLTVRLDDREFSVRRPESLPLRDALRLGELLTNMTNPSAEPDTFDTAVLETVALVAPEFVKAVKSSETIGLARSVAVFYVEHLSRAIEQIGADAAGTHGSMPPFFTKPKRHSDAPKSRPAITLASASSC